MLVDYEIMLETDYNNMTRRELVDQIDDLNAHIEELRDEIDNMMFVLHEKILEDEK